MAIDRDIIGKDFAGSSLLVTRSRLQQFAKATGQTDPIYLDPSAARTAGHPDLPVPPTFFFGVDLEGDASSFMDEIGVDLRTVLHGEQDFTYHRLAHAGDELTTTPTVIDVFDKKGGALEFLVRAAEITDQHGALVAHMRSTFVIQNSVTLTPEGNPDA